MGKGELKRAVATGKRVQLLKEAKVKTDINIVGQDFPRTAWRLIQQVQDRFN